MNITIEVDNNLAGMDALIGRTTWARVREKKGGSVFFPDGSLIAVGDPFGLNYVLRVVDDGGEADNTLRVSGDVKTRFYAGKASVTI